MTCWRGLFRSLAIPSLVFLFPLLALKESLTWIFYLSRAEIVTELSLRGLILLLLEAAAALAWCLAIAVLRLFMRSSERIEFVCRGVLTLIVIAASLRIALSNLEYMIQGNTTPGLFEAALVAMETLVVSGVGWKRTFAMLDQLNQSCEPALMGVPLLVVPVMLGGIGWRAYDKLPIAGVNRAVMTVARPDIVLISFDAFAAQDASLYGYHLPTTPNLEKLSHHSYNFTRFTSTSSFTTCAVSSVLTGLYPVSHRVYEVESHFPADVQTKNVATVLKQNGYSTAAIVTNPYAHPLHLYIEDSFTYLPTPPMTLWFKPSTYLLQLRHSLLFENLYSPGRLPFGFLFHFASAIPGFNHAPFTSPDEVFEIAEQFIAGAPTPYFLWIHVYPPHYPYMESPRYRGRFLVSNEFVTQKDFEDYADISYFAPSLQPTIDKLRLRYDENIVEIDDALGSFLEWMSRSKHANKTILIVTADHGEVFRHYFGHASRDLYYPELHVPLLISMPGQTTGLVRSESVDGTTLAPTILQLAGLQIPKWMEGHSLFDTSNDESRENASFAFSLRSTNLFRKSATAGTVAAIHGDYKLVWHFPEGLTSLYDINHDPEETKDLSRTNRAEVADFQARIRRRFPEMFAARTDARDTK